MIDWLKSKLTCLVLAAERSRPGNILYPVKRAVENTALSLSDSPAGKILLHIDHSNTRLEELELISKRRLSFRRNALRLRNLAKRYHASRYLAFARYDGPYPQVLR